VPTYDYKCRACGYAFEKFQSISAPAVRKCPRCGKLKVRRLIGGGSGVIFKGSGFYQTDYRSESYKKAAKAATEAASGGSKDKADAKKSNTKQESSGSTSADK